MKHITSLSCAIYVCAIYNAVYDFVASDSLLCSTCS